MNEVDASSGVQLSLDYQNRESETFLGELSEYILEQYGSNLREVNLIFPNRRAGLYFLKELSARLDGISWGPGVLSLEEFYESYSELTVVDRYSLVFRLFRIYRDIYKSDESLDNFFFWGEMLLKDFDETDKHLVSASHLFSTLSDYKSIEDIEFLDEDQKTIINGFWNSVQKSRDSTNWLGFWQKLSLLYSEFVKSLRSDGIGYHGLVLKDVIENLESIDFGNQQFIFAGFNALTRAEEKFIGFLVKEKGARIFWDYDKAFMSNHHEAGKFLRIYQKNQLLNRDITVISDDHLSEQKNIKVIGTGTWVGQLKVVGQLLGELSSQPGWEEESTVVVLPDEKLLLPLLNSIPSTIQDVNVTMGIVLRYTSSYSFLENLVLMFKGARRVEEGAASYYYKNILNILRHPLYQSIQKGKAGILEKTVKMTKKLHYNAKELSELGIGPDLLFLEAGNGLISQMSEIAYYFFNNAPNRLEKIFLNALFHHLDRLASSIHEYEIELGFDAIIRLLRQIASTGRIPFSGEPVKGLQIMGVFETRNIDFDNVFILSLNEGFFPRGLTSQSFIPFALRKAYRMPTFEDSQSIQSYLFYRLLQRSKRVHLVYNSIGEVIGGEVSRYVQQLKYGELLTAEFLHLKESYQPDDQKTISVHSTEHISESLSRYFQAPAYLSPTALNTYMECSLKFYFKYILKLREDTEVEEDIDARVYGTLLHESAEYLYGKFKGKIIDDEQVLQDGIDGAIDYAFGNTVFDDTEGHPRIRKEILQRTLQKLIKRDSKNFPLEVIDVEPKVIVPVTVETLDGNIEVNIGGKLDRVDKSKGSLRVIDYKTGPDEPKYDDLETLFSGQNKAAFQLFCYSYLLSHSDMYENGPLRPELYSMRKIFTEDFSPYLKEGNQWSRKVVYDIRDKLTEFEERLKGLLKNIFVDQEYQQTDQLKNCKYCEFTSICRRQFAKSKN